MENLNTRKTRVDEWTDAEKEMLTEWVLEAKAQGKKMKDIWEEAAELLSETGRTVATCSWMWYNRLNPEKGAERTERHVTVTESTVRTDITPADISTYIESLISERDMLREENTDLKSQALVDQVKYDLEIKRLQDRIEELENDNNTMMRVFEKARRMTFVDDEPRSRAHFKMDQNGNLEPL